MRLEFDAGVPLKNSSGSKASVQLMRLAFGGVCGFFGMPRLFQGVQEVQGVQEEAPGERLEGFLGAGCAWAEFDVGAVW